MIEVTESNFNEVVIKSTKPVLVDFWAPWCPPCLTIAPYIEGISKDQTAVQVGKVNVDENPDLSAQLGIRSIPTLIIFKDGKPVASTTGALPRQKIEEWMKEHV